MAGYLVKLWIRTERDPAGIDWQAWLPTCVEVAQAELTSLPPAAAEEPLAAPAAVANAEHPLAQWLRRVADLLDRIYVRTYNPKTGCWGNTSLADLELQETASRIALWLVEGRTPVAVPARKEQR